MTQSAVAAHFTGVGGGLVMSLIAFSIVFIVIMGLMFIMMGMKHVCRAIDGCKKAPVSAPAAPSAPASPAAKAVAVPAVGDDGELLAVISAAIAAMCGSAARVVFFAPAKAPAGSSWKFIGRIQNAEGFQD